MPKMKKTKETTYLCFDDRTEFYEVFEEFFIKNHDVIKELVKDRKNAKKLYDMFGDFCMEKKW